MSIFDKIAELESKVNYLYNCTPTWIPLSHKLLENTTYTTVDGLRKYCINNIHPEKFKKFGRQYHIHKDAWFGLIK
jgi:hypothetical protein